MLGPLRVQSVRGKRLLTARKLGFQPRNVLEQALRYEADEVEAEPRILEVELLNLIVTDLQQGSCFKALQRLRAAALRGEKSKLADHVRRGEFDATLDKPVTAGDENEHSGGDISLVEENFPTLHEPRRRERLDPVQIAVSLRRFAHLFGQLPHLVQTQGVQWQQYRMENQHRIQATEIPVGDESAVAADP